MRLRVPSRRMLLLLALALVVLVLAVAGCGSSGAASPSSSPAATAASGQSADQIVKDSAAKMATIQSASFSADFGLQVQGDTSKMTDPTSKALLTQGITVHAEGKSQSKPASAVDMTMSLGIAGQNIDFGLRAVGKKVWVQYQGAWYAVDAKSTRTLGSQAQASSAPTQLKNLGIDPSSLASYQLLGTEDLNGVQVYHVKATADPKKLAAALMKAATDPTLSKELGGASSQLGTLGSGLTQQGKQQAQQLAKSLKTATVDLWIGVDDQYLYKAQFDAALDTTGQQGAQGVTGMTLKGSVALSGFNEPVKVAKPTSAKPFKTLLNQLFGGMLGGSSSLSF